MYLKKNILLASISAPPKNAPESLQTAKYLEHLKKRFNITLITSANKKGWRPVDESLLFYLKGITQLIEVNLFDNRYLLYFIRKIVPSLLSKPDEDFSFYRKWKKIIKRVNTQPDIIYTRSTPFSSALLGEKLKEYYQCPWIMHLSDPWCENPFLSCKGKNRNFLEKLEKKCFTKADLITFTSEKTIDIYKEKYKNLSHKFYLCPNVFDSSEINKDKITFTDKLKVVFTGRLYKNRNVKPLIATLELLKKEKSEILDHVEFIFAGFVDDLNYKMLTQSGFKCIKYLGHLNFNDTLKLQRSAHILLIIDAHDNSGQSNMFFPSKILDYMAARRPILAISSKNSTTTDIVGQNFGYCFEHEDIFSLKSFLIEAMSSFKNKDLNFFKISSVPVKYSASYNANKLSDLITKLCG